MATLHGQINPVERDIASAQLDELELAYGGQPSSAWKEALLQWHLRAVTAAQAEAWIPGLRPQYDQFTERALTRFYDHHLRAAISRLTAENLELRRKMIAVAECARFYASGATDTGARANSALRTLLALSETAPWNRNPENELSRAAGRRLD